MLFRSDKVFKDMDEMEGYYGENVEKNHYDRLLLDIYDSDYKKVEVDRGSGRGDLLV